MSDLADRNYDDKGVARPLARLAYMSIVTGRLYVVWGFAVDFKTKDKEIVILSNLDNSEVTYFSLAEFFTPAPENHPQAGKPRFQLVTPT